jgi:flagellar biosynthesis/type III secretory pathway protein FliH
LLQQAVNAGYQQGYNAGVRDRRYGYGGNYYMNDRVYRTGTYGYQSYVNRDLYQYYFQQGFQRGYQDGVNNSFRYGSRTSTGLSILGNVLGTILQLAND